MLLQKNRLKRKRDFDITYKHGHFFRGTYITVKVWKIDPEVFPKRGFSVEDVKIGVVVGKKVYKSAVKRNRIKRQVREVFRLLVKERAMKSGFFVVCMVQSLPEDITYGKIEKDVMKVLTKTNILSKRIHKK